MSKDLILTINEIICEKEDFGGEIKPLLILEGKTDEDTYYKVLDKVDVSINDLEVILANGKKNILDFHEKNKDEIKYLAILDKDHSHRDGSKIEDSSLLYTHFYDMENYLTSINVVYSTYEDLKNIKTVKISKEDFLNKMLHIAYPSLLATEYKLSYLESNSKESTIYSVSKLIKIKDNRLRVDNYREIEDIVKNRIDKYFVSKNLRIDIDIWSKAVNCVNENIKNKDIDVLDIYIQNMLKGRIILEIYEVLFNEIFKDSMKNRKGDIFKSDLRKNILTSKECILLASELDYNLNKILTS